MMMWWRVLAGSSSIRIFNKTHVVLIQKIGHPRRVSDFRPISLCNMVYKIVTKTLANRLKLVLSHIISDEQSAFVPNRLISDNVIVAYEAMHSLRRKTGGKVGFVALKLDMSKAYDRVEWRYLLTVMEHMGFSIRWRSIIRDAMESASFSFIINGESYGDVRPSRGLCQGCPLSPYFSCYVLRVFQP